MRRLDLRSRLFWAFAALLVTGALLVAAPETLASFNSRTANPSNVFSNVQVQAAVLNSATPGAGGTVAVGWTASPTPGVTYTVMRAQGAGGYAAVVSGLSGTSYSDTLPGQGTFSYLIRAVVSTFTSDSNSRTVTWTLPVITGWAVCDTDGLVAPSTADWVTTAGHFEVFASVTPGSAPVTSVVANAGMSGSAAFASPTLAAGGATCAGTSYGYSSAAVATPSLAQGAAAVWVDVVVTDALGDKVHSNASQAGNVGADTTAPTIGWSFAFGGGSGSGTVTFFWSGSDSGGSGIAGYQLNVYLAGTSNRAPQYPSAIDVAAGSWSYTFNLTSGTRYDLAVQPVDNAGNNGSVTKKTGVTAP